MRNLILTITLALIAIPAFAEQAKKVNPCTLVTKAEVQAAVGNAQVGNGVVNEANAGACEFAVGEAGTVAVLVPPYSDWAQFEAQSKQMNIKITAAPNIGDKAYFADPGYGIQQVHAFKGKTYIIVTVSVPGLNDQKNRDVAVKVVQKVLPRI